MTTLTIPKELTQRGELVIIPRKEYEDFLKFRIETMKQIKEIELTQVQKRALSQARKNLSRGKFLTIYEFKQKLGIVN